MTSKRQNASDYIKDLINIYFGETMPTKESANTQGEIKNIKILPYETVKALFLEYLFYCDIHRISEGERAGFSCFKAAYRAHWIKGDVRLLGSKGSFPTCEICNKVWYARLNM